MSKFSNRIKLGEIYREIRIITIWGDEYILLKGEELFSTPDGITIKTKGKNEYFLPAIIIYRLDLFKIGGARR